MEHLIGARMASGSKEYRLRVAFCGVASEASHVRWIRKAFRTDAHSFLQPVIPC